MLTAHIEIALGIAFLGLAVTYLFRFLKHRRELRNTLASYAQEALEPDGNSSEEPANRSAEDLEKKIACSELMARLYSAQALELKAKAEFDGVEAHWGALAALDRKISLLSKQIDATKLENLLRELKKPEDAEMAQMDRKLSLMKKQAEAAKLESQLRKLAKPENRDTGANQPANSDGELFEPFFGSEEDWQGGQGFPEQGGRLAL